MKQLKKNWQKAIYRDKNMKINRVCISMIGNNNRHKKSTPSFQALVIPDNSLKLLPKEFLQTTLKTAIEQEGGIRSLGDDSITFTLKGEPYTLAEQSLGMLQINCERKLYPTFKHPLKKLLHLVNLQPPKVVSAFIKLYNCRDLNADKILQEAKKVLNSDAIKHAKF